MAWEQLVLDLAGDSATAAPTAATAAAEGADSHAMPAKRTRAAQQAVACPLCGGRLVNDVCDRCGMEVMR